MTKRIYSTTAPTAATHELFPGYEWVDSSGNVYEWNSLIQGWVQTSVSGAALVADVGIASQKHDRYLTGITATWPGNDTFSVSFTQDENVRRYRWRFITTSGVITHVKVVEDAVNEAQEEVWLADATTSRTADVENRRLETSGVWSEWIELSKDANDLSLSRLGFLAAGTTPVVAIHVEAE